MPARFDEMKRSSARVGAVTALSRAKAWVPKLESADVATGYPSLKEDGTPFDQNDFAAYVKEIRPMATQIANELNGDINQYIEHEEKSPYPEGQEEIRLMIRLPGEGVYFAGIPLFPALPMVFTRPR